MPKTYLALAVLALASAPVSASMLVAPSDDRIAEHAARANFQPKATGPTIDFVESGNTQIAANAQVASANPPNLVLDGALQANPGASPAQGSGATYPYGRLVLPKAQSGLRFPFASVLGLILLALGGVTAVMLRRRPVHWPSRDAEPERFSRSGGRNRRRSGRRRR